MLETLNKRYAIEDCCRVVSGGGGHPKIELKHQAGGTADLYLRGAFVSSWKHPAAGEVLFLSKGAELSKDKYVHGGIPVIFPQFGAGLLPMHGFVRSLDWELRGSRITEEGGVSVTLSLSDGKATRGLWPFVFRCEYTVTLDERLRTELRVFNVANRPLTFTCALHSYFAVEDVRKTVLSGLENCRYIDTLSRGRVDREGRQELRFTREIDRIYTDTPESLNLTDEARGLQIGIEKRNLPDAVVWNPWTITGGELGDLETGEYLKMLCVEAAATNRCVTLQPGTQWSGYQTLTVKKKG